MSTKVDNKRATLTLDDLVLPRKWKSPKTKQESFELCSALVLSLVRLITNFGDFLARTEPDRAKPPSASYLLCASPPQLILERFALRLAYQLQADPSSFVVARALLERIYAYQGGLFAEPCRHKLLAAVLIVATKSNQDRCFKNIYYSKCACVDLPTMNCLELELLSALRFHTFVNDIEFERHYSTMVEETRICVPLLKDRLKAGTLPAPVVALFSPKSTGELKRSRSRSRGRTTVRASTRPEAPLSHQSTCSSQAACSPKRTKMEATNQALEIC